ncbi:MAG: VacJ family lipoprotein [Rhodospirillales bacterium]|nr:VacJ family lipoprotein [Alphaproteobacteria bacterium]MCB1840606.1 VacJ family lipoprotein [Alphaproteobacteria bacterium]MCB9977238.1 VacJ family lipoprotein [Rhodospirillales bacterium]
MVSNLKKVSLILLSGLVLVSCASKESSLIVEDDLEIYDPYEGYNRFMFNFNQHFDDIVVNPFIKGYRFVTPRLARKGIRNFLRNIKSPVTFANQLLQGDVKGAEVCLLRAAINTTVGLGGLIDLAGYNGLEYEGEDFGQTLAVWGVDHGPYMVVPFLGPSSLRDYSGYFVDGMADPLRWYLFNIDERDLFYTKLGADYVDIRESLYDTLKDIRQNSLDPYAATRSIYYQSRRALVSDQNMESGFNTPSIPDYDEED